MTSLFLKHGRHNYRYTGVTSSLISLGIVGKDYVLLAADATANFSIIVMKQNEDKIYPMDNNKLLAGCGEAGDRVQFCEYIEVCLQVYSIHTVFRKI